MISINQSIDYISRIAYEKYEGNVIKWIVINQHYNLVLCTLFCKCWTFYLRWLQCTIWKDAKCGDKRNSCYLKKIQSCRSQTLLQMTLLFDIYSIENRMNTSSVYIRHYHLLITYCNRLLMKLSKVMMFTNGDSLFQLSCLLAYFNCIKHCHS